ncbi:glycosyltransferase family 4 protein [Marivirga sp.]|uniref:glycosyltransferase family 4 protein n=1 Tax=Marivirga sp. TaxID=2018662 RepID=UPI0025D297B1|nr:glycosyltransferase family 4 protein [Marivirga sp.]
MKVLWITNTLFPAVCKELKLPLPVVGGWMYSAAESLIKVGEEIELGVASLYNGKELRSVKIEGINYFLVPKQGKGHLYSVRLEAHWRDVQDQFVPDLVHIHGSEYPHGLAYINGCGNKNVTVSIQGLVSVYERYYYGGISESELQQNVTLRDRIRRDSIFRQRKKMQERGAFEKLLLGKVNHVIGRTSWDKAHVWANNPNATYHFCNETLRREFYQGEWMQEDCEKHSIFLSQAYYPIKGLHQMVEALPLILRDWPDVKVYVAGDNFMVNKPKWRMNGFGKYIDRLMKENKVEDKFIFTGTLSGNEMRQRYLDSNVFVCPSSIENSPNSIGEAQLLGVPCVASYVGGVADMISDHETGLLYRFEEVEMLAESICQVFKDQDLANKLSKQGKLAAAGRHSQSVNSEKLNSIYQTICKK